MKEKKIMLPTVEIAKKFVAEASKCDFDIDVFYNRVTIDAKSILGVLSLDLTKVLTVQFNGENREFEAYLESVYKAGAEKASYVANKTLRKVYKKVGFVAR